MDIIARYGARHQDLAAALYDGGWRAADRQQLKKQTTWDIVKIDTVCGLLARMERQAKENR